MTTRSKDCLSKHLLQSRAATGSGFCQWHESGSDVCTSEEVSKEGALPLSFPLVSPPGWNADMMAAAGAVIFGPRRELGNRGHARMAEEQV